jgi:hydroxymethylglutaryl-CoA reductase
MKVTTVRFGVDLWGLLDAEAARVGVSVSQYIREAALARAAAAAAARGEEPLGLLGRSHPGAIARQPFEAARDQAAEERDEAKALRAQKRTDRSA